MTPGSSPCSPTASAAPTTARAPRSTSSRRSSGPSGPPSPPTPSASCSTSASARTTTWPTRSSARPLKREVDKLENRGYADNGIQAFKDAAAEFMKQAVRRRRSTRPRRSTTASAPSRPWPCCRPCFINPGDVTLMTVPGYPVAGTHTELLRRRGLQPAAAARRTASSPTSTRIPADIKQRAKLLVINYPNSPTGAVATRGLLPAGHRLRPQATRSSSCRTRPTSC